MSFGIPVRNGLAIGLLSSTTLSSRRGLSPAMSLDFLQPFLDSRITFSRGSNATRVDATGKITYAPANLLRYSEELDNAVWTKVQSGTGVAPTVTANSGASPTGTTTADRIQFSLGGGTTVSDWSSIYQFLTYAIATNYVYSVWLRSNDSNSYTLLARDDAGSGASSALWTVTPTWQRFSYVATSTSTNSSGLRLWLRGASGTSSTADVLAWGAQLEPVTYQTTPSTYVATTASAYYGPRFDYDPVTLAPKGLLIEEARTNLLTYSQQFDDASWTKNNGTVTANSTASPEGTVTADSFIASAGAAFHYVNRTSGGAFTGAHVYSFYVKKNTATWIFFTVNDASINYFNLDTGLFGTTLDTCTAAPAGNGWYRITVSRTLAAASAHCGVGVAGSNGGANFTAVGTESIFLYGAQLEAGSFATSYIPTVASTVTRSADVATMTGTNFSSWYNQPQGTFVMNFTPDGGLISGSTRVLSTTSGSVLNRVVDVNFSGGSWTNFNGTATTVIGAASVTSTPQRIAVAYASANYGYTLNGGAVVADTSALVNSPTRLNLGYLDTGNYLNGHIRQIAYYNTRLPATQLQTLTAPSLATTLSLSFTNQAYTVGV